MAATERAKDSIAIEEVNAVISWLKEKFSQPGNYSLESKAARIVEAAAKLYVCGMEANRIANELAGHARSLNVSAEWVYSTLADFYKDLQRSEEAIEGIAGKELPLHAEVAQHGFIIQQITSKKYEKIEQIADRKSKIVPCQVPDMVMTKDDTPAAILENNFLVLCILRSDYAKIYAYPRSIMHTNFLVCK